MSQAQITNDNTVRSNGIGESFSEEDMSFCKAWMAISLNGITGTDQRVMQFFYEQADRKVSGGTSEVDKIVLATSVCRNGHPKSRTRQERLQKPQNEKPLVSRLRFLATEGFKKPRCRKQLEKRNSAKLNLEAAKERMQKRISKRKETHSYSLAQNEMSIAAAILALDPFAPEVQNNPDWANAIKLLSPKSMIAWKKKH
ncbi:hypothetical protein A0J61_06046 [Choanephora cucurbitarum]|uniref:Uncharacterized protein n=1 Tax=Choanephora cucurbitarum TaxID=101091 RepID=A0A1C7NA29_9FUNG|nr:hypothetical protein A0J61_06046 [Choanephora cucurbitarum]